MDQVVGEPAAAPENGPERDGPEDDGPEENGPEGGGRRVSWTELFFDLVFVVVVAQLTQRLHGEPAARDFGAVAVLLLPAWWAWVNISATSNLLDRDSTRKRALLLVATLAVGIMATAIPAGLGSRAWLFAVGYALTRVVLLVLWLPEVRHDRRRWWLRPVAYNAGSGAIWLASIAVPAPGRFVLWGAALVLEIVLLGRLSGAHFDVRHLVERVGLVVMIVFGESVASLVTSADEHLTPAAGAIALAGFVLLGALWWSYFDFANRAAEERLSGATPAQVRDTLIYANFFVTGGLIMLAAGLGTAVADAGATGLPAGARWAAGGGLALYHLAHAVVSLRYGRSLRRVLTWAVPGVGLPLAVVLFGAGWPPLLAVSVLAAEALSHLLLATRATRTPAG